MPDAQSALNITGGITQALLAALDQIEQFAAASQIGADGKPSASAVYMHMSMGFPIDPTMYAHAWTPAGLDSSSQLTNDGAFAAPAPTPVPAAAPPPAGPAGSVYPPPAPTPAISKEMAASMQNAYYTAALVDNMLEVTDKGVAAAWPDRRVSVEYYTVVKGMQPVDPSQPAPDVLAKVNAAQKLLYLEDTDGDLIGYSPLYAQYRHNRTAWTTAVAEQAAAYAKALTDPVAGAAYPVEAATYANKVTQALDDFNAMGRQKVEDALDTLATVGEDATTAIAAMARQLWDAYNVQLSGEISANTPWSYINPVSWWDHTDTSFGVQQINTDSSQFAASSGNGTSSFARDWYHQQSQSVSAHVGVSVGFAGGSASASHSDARDAFSSQADQASWSHYSDSSASAQISFEYFLATIERPWFLGDIFNIKGWYLVGHKANDISDGKIITQVGDEDKLLPMVPKAFVIVRNVVITADDWGTAGSALDTAAQNASGSASSSANSVAVSVHYLCASASAKYNNQQSTTNFGGDDTSNNAWSRSSDGKGGTLKLLGSQIVGWIGEIQPPSPLQDDPNPPAAAGATSATSSTSTPSTTPATAGATS